MDVVVGLAVADTYLSCTAITNGINIAELKRGVGTSFKTLRELGVSDTFLTPGDRSEADSLSRAARLAGIKEFLDTFPYDILGNGAFIRLDADPDTDPDPPADRAPDPFTDNADLFMEGLMNNVRNCVVSHQSFVFKTAKKKRIDLENKIKALYADPVANIEEITDLEYLLNKLVDSELRHELGKYSGFEVLNSEKLTLYFLSLAKASQVEAKMEDIRNVNGERFDSPSDSKTFIREFYSNIYRKDPEEPENLDGCVERFLGPDICNNPIVTNSKLPFDIKTRLDRPLTIHELDISILQANKSASGMDGMSNCFIKKFWRFFRLPLYRYAKCVLQKRRLTPSFRSGLIKLIPKKGDTSQITNWRPISLLSCMYKILSRALNNRLKVARDFIFSRAQKGFTNSRYIQEVLINLCETIGFCNKHEIPACIVTIDQAKAFDTISNAYMLEAYKFFGLGEYMINLLSTLGSGRVACISFHDGTVSDPFDLERGRTQGNGPSPCEYNIGQQILLFKLELSPDLASVYNHLLIPRTVLGTIGNIHPSITNSVQNESDIRFPRNPARKRIKRKASRMTPALLQFFLFRTF